MGNNGDIYYQPLIDPFNSDTQYYYRVQSDHYSGAFADVTAPSSANFPGNGSPTRYFVELPMAIDVSDLSGARPMLVYNVTDTTLMTRVGGAPGAQEYRVPPSTSNWRNVIEINSAQASDVLGFDYYGLKSIINAERANYIYNTLFTGNPTISGTLSGNMTFDGNPTLSGTINLTGGITENSVTYKTKILNIGDFNMNTSPYYVDVAHGLTFANIIHVSAMIRNDANTEKHPIDYYDSGGGQVCGGCHADATYITLLSFTGLWRTINYDSTSYNRGWIFILYTV